MTEGRRPAILRTGSTSCDWAGSYIALRGWEDVSRRVGVEVRRFVSRWTLLGLLWAEVDFVASLSDIDQQHNKRWTQLRARGAE